VVHPEQFDRAMDEVTGTHMMLNANAGAIDQLMRELCKLPGIGPKSADRLTHYLLANGRDRALAWQVRCSWSPSVFAPAPSVST